MNYQNHLTLILLVHDNTKFPERWIEYASFIKLPYKIFIADGGKTNLFNQYINKNLTNLNLNIEYFRYDHEKNFTDYYKKSYDVLSKVKTSYVLICSDDDFVVPSGIEQALNFLKNNNDYSSARGEILGIKFYKYSNQEKTYGSDYEIITHSSQVSTNLEHENIEERLFSHLRNYQITFFDIHKTKDLQFAYQKLLKLNPKVYILHEFITSGFTVLKGKVYRGDFSYLIRDHGPSGTTYNEKKFITQLDWLTKTSWGTEYNSMINSFIDYINENKQTSGNKYDIHQALIIFFRKRLIYNLYENDSKLLLIFVFILIRIELFFNFKNLLNKIKKIYKKNFCKVTIKNNLIIKNKKIINLNCELAKFIDFLKINNHKI